MRIITRKARRTAISVAIGVCLSAAAQAQVPSGTIVGRAPPNASITLTSPDSGVRKEIRANPDGSFTIAQLPPGRYRVVADGMARDVTVTSGADSRVAFEGAQHAETVTVTGSRIQRDTFNSVSPVQIITREDSTLAGFNNTTSVLQSTAVTAGGPQINNAFGGFVVDGGPGVNTISLIGIPYFNQNAVEAKGVDFEVNYRRGVNFFGGGDVGLRFLSSWLDERNNVSSTGTVTHLAGTLGLPELTSLVQGSFYKNRMGVTLSWRWTDSMIANQNWNFNGTSTRWDVLDNEIAAENVVDVRFNYRFDTGSGNVNFFVNVNNLFDEQPEENLGVYSSNFSTGTGLGVTGENRGRRASLGVNVDFGRNGGPRR